MLRFFWLARARETDAHFIRAGDHGEFSLEGDSQKNGWLERLTRIESRLCVVPIDAILAIEDNLELS